MTWAPVMQSEGTYDQFMNERVVPKMTNICVVKLSNSLAIICVPRLELDHFESQPDSLRINQGFLDQLFQGVN